MKSLMLFKINACYVIKSIWKHKDRNALFRIIGIYKESTVKSCALRKFHNLAITLQTKGDVGTL